jgi:hypothetical protein
MLSDGATYPNFDLLELGGVLLFRTELWDYTSGSFQHWSSWLFVFPPSISS